MNKKQVALIALVVVTIIGGALWCKGKSSRKSVFQSETIGSQVDSVEFENHLLNLVVPSSWGSLVTWNAGNEGNLVEGPYRGKDILRGWGSGELGGATRNFSKYPYMSLNAPKTNVAANVTLSLYPEKFSDDTEVGPGSMLKQQKEAAFQPLFRVFQQRGLGDLNLEQKLIISSNDESIALLKSPRGLWWGNGWAVDDKVAVRYFENVDGSLRGIGFFNFSTQEPGYGAGSATYRVVLLNADKRMLVEFYLPMDEFKELEQFYDAENEFGIKEGKANKAGLIKEYAYLENQTNYQNTELGKFMDDVKKMVQSAKLVE